jgi:hypothetical protein
VKATVILGVLLGLLVAFPSPAEPVGTAARRLPTQPVVRAFAAGIIARPRIARRLPRRLP